MPRKRRHPRSAKFGGGEPGDLRRMLLDILRLWGPCGVYFLADLIEPVREVSYQTIRERLAKMEREGLVERRFFDRLTLWQVVGWDAPPQA